MPSDGVPQRAIRLAALATFGGLFIAYLILKYKKKVEDVSRFYQMNVLNCFIPTKRDTNLGGKSSEPRNPTDSAFSELDKGKGFAQLTEDGTSRVLKALRIFHQAKNATEKEQLLEEGCLKRQAPISTRVIEDDALTSGSRTSFPNAPETGESKRVNCGPPSLKTADEKELASDEGLADDKSNERKHMIESLDSLCDLINKNAEDQPFCITVRQASILVRLLTDEDKDVLAKSLGVIQAVLCTEENRIVLYDCGILKEFNSLIDKLPDSDAVATPLLYCIGNLAAVNDLHDKMTVFLPKLISITKSEKKEGQLRTAALAALVNFTRIIRDSEIVAYKELIPELLKCASRDTELEQQSYAFAIMHNLSKVPELAVALGEHP